MSESLSQPGAPKSDRTDRPQWTAAYLTVGAVVLALYARTVGYGYLAYDDLHVLVENPVMQGRGWEHFAALWLPGGNPHEMLYVPLFTGSIWLEQATGLGPGLHHAVNVLLHAANALLLLRLAQRLGVGVWPGLLGALLFAVHPVQVETVAWCMGRKDLLATLGCLGAAHAYLSWLRGGRAGAYLAALAAFLLAGLGKPTVIALPLALPLWHWAAGRRDWREAVGRALPFVALSGLLYVLNGRLTEVASVPLGTRLAVAAGAPGQLWQWLWRLVSLQGYSSYYRAFPLPVAAISIWAWLAWLAALAAVWLARRQRPLVTLLATLGLGLLPAVVLLLEVGRPFSTADRYFYLPLAIGGGLLAGAGERLATAGRWRLVVGLVLGLWLLAAASQTVRRVPLWANDEALWTDALRQDPENFTARQILAARAFAREDYAEARKHWREALRAMPRNADFAVGCGRCSDLLDEPEAAARWYRLARIITPGHRDASLSLAGLRRRQGRAREALRILVPLLTDHPSDVRLRFEVALAFKAAGELGPAARAFEQVTVLAPDNAEGWRQYAVLRHRQGQLEVAERAYRQALALDPSLADCRYNLGELGLQSRRPAEAYEHFRAYADAATEPRTRLEGLIKCGQAARLQGRTELAREHFAAALAVGPPLLPWMRQELAAVGLDPEAEASPDLETTDGADPEAGSP